MPPTVLARRQSPFNAIVVTRDESGLVTLRFGDEGPCQSVVNPEDPRHLELEYSRALPLCLTLMRRPRRMLILGLGGGSVPRFFHHYFPELEIDVVEIDPAVVEIAKEYCGFCEDDRMRVHIEDGRDFIEARSGCYDLISLDGFDDESIPAHLRTTEFLQAVRQALTPDGVAVGNVWGRTHNALYEDMLVTYRDAFACVYVFDVPGPGTKIFAALGQQRSVTRAEVARLANEITQERRFSFNLRDSLAGFRSAEAEHVRGGEVLRD